MLVEETKHLFDLPSLSKEKHNEIDNIEAFIIRTQRTNDN